MANELLQKDIQIEQLTRLAEQSKTILKQKEKIFDQDANTRFQLGQKMQALFNEKEDLQDEIEELKVSYIYNMVICLLLFFANEMDI